MTEAKLHRKKKHNAIFLSLLVCWFTSLRFMDLFLCSPSIMQNSSGLNPTGRVEVGNEDNACCSSCLLFLLCISEVAQWLRTKGTQVKNPGRFVLPVFAQVFPAGGRREVRHRSECCWTSCQLFQNKTPPTNYMLHVVWLCIRRLLRRVFPGSHFGSIPPHLNFPDTTPHPPCLLITAAYFHLLSISSSALCWLAFVTLELIKENKKGPHRYLKSMLSVKNNASFATRQNNKSQLT